MSNKTLEKELAQFLEEQATYLAPIPIEQLQKHIIELEKNRSAGIDHPSIDTSTVPKTDTSTAFVEVVPRKEETSPIKENIELLIIVTKKDAYDIAQSSKKVDSESSLLLKNLLKAVGLDHKKRRLHALDIPDERSNSTAVDSDTLTREEVQSNISSRLKSAIKLIQPSFILVFGEMVIPFLNGSTVHDERPQNTPQMGEIFELEGTNCLITHSIDALLHNKSHKRETWEHVQKIPSNF